MRTSLEVADIFRCAGPAYRAAHAGHLSLGQLKVMTAIENCRTAALGGHVEACDECGHWRVAYNSCRNRHCPKCQGAAARTWLAAREADLLPVGYFHVVFTVPAEIATIAWQNKAVIYDLLFRAAADTLLTIAADTKHLGARVGITAVLHTWGSALTHHPHVHMIVPGGGIALDGTRWISSRPAFLLPVRVLGALFRRLFLTRLRALFDAGKLGFFGAHAHLAARMTFLRHLSPIRKKRWVVYAKPPFAGPQAVLAYLWRYTHRVAISNRRLIGFDEACVTFRYKDYRRDAAERHLALARAEGTAQRFYSMSAQIRAERKTYYDMLETTQRGGLDITGWLLWFIDCLDRAFDRAESILANVMRKARFWDSMVGQSLNDRQQKVLNRVLNGFEGKLTNAKWAAMTKTSSDTALRDINDLVRRGILQKDSAGGRSAGYSLVDEVKISNRSA